LEAQRTTISENEETQEKTHPQTPRVGHPQSETQPASANGSSEALMQAVEVEVNKVERSAGGEQVEAELAAKTLSVAASGMTAEQAMEIRGAIQAQQKFLGELLEHAHRWELENAELRIYFATEKRAFAELIEGRESLEKIRATASRVLNRSVRVCAKMESVAAASANASLAASGAKELREKFERDPMVRSMLQRFGGKISEVKRREERS
jgi:hypothetical protein